MEEVGRRIFATGKTSVIRDVLSLLTTGVKLEADLTLDTREKLEPFTTEICDRLIFDVRTAKEAFDQMSTRVRNLRASHVGQVLVITGEVTEPGILREIEVIHRPHHTPAHLASGLRSFVHMLF